MSKRKYERVNLSLDKVILGEMRERKEKTGIPVSRQVELSWKELKKRLG